MLLACLIWGYLFHYVLGLPDSCNNFSLMSYNVHGLPRFMTLDPTYERIDNISKNIIPYEFDILNFQEDWTNLGNSIILNNLPEYNFSYRLNEFDHEYSMFGSGLLQLSKLQPTNVQEEVFKKHYGYDDIWANKGFQVIHLPDFDIYNTHLDAGTQHGDQQARADNLDQLTVFIKTWSIDRAIIIGGDTNLYNNTIDNLSYDNIISELNLTEITERSKIDKFFYRNGINVNIEPIFVKIDDFNNLSDHKMISADFNICTPY